MNSSVASAQPPRDQKTILVVGMHRSGTSVLARIVNLMGAFVGAEAELVPAHEKIGRAHV